MSTLLCPLAALAVNVLTQIIVFRFRRGTQYFRSIVESFLSGAVAFVMLEAMVLSRGNPLNRDMATAFLVDAPTYLALAYCGFAFIQLGQTSIRIRMYSEIVSTRSGISVEELDREYDDKALMRERLRRLVESGDIVEKEGRYFVGRKRFLLFSNILFFAKRILLGREREFE